MNSVVKFQCLYDYLIQEIRQRYLRRRLVNPVTHFQQASLIFLVVLSCFLSTQDRIHRASSELKSSILSIRGTSMCYVKFSTQNYKSA